MPSVDQYPALQRRQVCYVLPETTRPCALFYKQKIPMHKHHSQICRKAAKIRASMFPDILCSWKHPTPPQHNSDGLPLLTAHRATYPDPVASGERCVARMCGRSWSFPLAYCEDSLRLVSTVTWLYRCHLLWEGITCNDSLPMRF